MVIKIKIQRADAFHIEINVISSMSTLKNSGEVSSSAAFRKHRLIQPKPKHWSQFKTFEGMGISIRVKKSRAKADLEIFAKGMVVF